MVTFDERYFPFTHPHEMTISTLVHQVVYVTLHDSEQFISPNASTFSMTPKLFPKRSFRDTR